MKLFKKNNVPLQLEMKNLTLVNSTYVSGVHLNFRSKWC
jgi:hypothetical protein